MKKILLILGCIIALALVIFIDFFLFPLVLQQVLLWFGIEFALWQCFVIIFVIYAFKNWV